MKEKLSYGLKIKNYRTKIVESVVQNVNDNKKNFKHKIIINK